MFANGPGDSDSIPGRVIPKTQEMVLNATLLYIQHYKVRIKGKVEQSSEQSSALLHLSLIAIEKGAFGSPSTNIANLTYFYTYIYICVCVYAYIWVCIHIGAGTYLCVLCWVCVWPDVFCMWTIHPLLPVKVEMVNCDIKDFSFIKTHFRSLETYSLTISLCAVYGWSKARNYEIFTLVYMQV